MLFRYAVMLASVLATYFFPPEAANWQDDLTLRTMASVALITVALGIGRKSMCFILVAAFETVSIIANLILGIEYFLGGDARWYPWAQAAILVSEVGCLLWGLSGVGRLQRDYDHCTAGADNSPKHNSHNNQDNSTL